MFFLKNIISNSKLEAGDWNMRYSICLETYLIFKNSIKESLSMEFGRFSCDFRVFRCLIRFLSISLEIDGFAVHTQSLKNWQNSMLKMCLVLFSSLQNVYKCINWLGSQSPASNFEIQACKKIKTMSGHQFSLSSL